jgi:hypothetical protein
MDINISRWNQTASQSLEVNPKASLKQRVTEKSRGIKRKKQLSDENQQYLERRLRTDFSV